MPSSQPAVSAPVSSIKHAYPDFVKKRLRLGTLHRDESEIRTQQLRKLRTIVLQDPSLSELGGALVSAAGALQDEDIVARSFRDAFMSKSTGTLIKRSHRFGVSAPSSMIGESLLWISERSSCMNFSTRFVRQIVVPPQLHRFCLL